jgi:hypothetical protein
VLEAGERVRLLALGTCTLEATQPGDAVYAPAAPRTRSFAVVGQVARTAGRSISYTK